MFENLKGYNLILASGSPRRNELMKGLGLKFSVMSLKDVDESYPESLRKEDIALFIATKKAEAYRERMKSDDIIITADTIVCKDGEVLGKPSSRDDAVRMLRMLSGGSHWVYTGVCITSCLTRRSFTSATEVVFSELSDEEIYWYVDNCKPKDKAGAYGVQEWIGYIGVEKISGSYYNVMGLPVQQLYRELRNFR